MTSLQPPTPRRAIANRADPGLLVTVALCAFALWPLLYRAGLPNGTDVLYHVYRVAEMDRTWTRGVLLPHWAESFYYGYGSPVFHYYAGLTYYLTSIFARLFGTDAVNSLRLLIALGVFAKGAGMYLFLRGRAGKLAGVIAALVYVYSPYILFTEPYARGDYPEFLAFVLLPFLFWRFDRLLLTRGGRDLLLAALTLGALVITHNLMAVVLTGLLAAWLAWNKIVGIVGWRRFALAGAALGCGVGLAAYFWLPILLERSEVHLDNLIAVAQLDYRNFFVPLDDLLGLNPRIDAGAINGLTLNLRLGVASWALAATGVLNLGIAQFKTQRKGTEAQRRKETSLSLITHYSSLVTFFTLMAAVMIFLMLPASEGVWAAVGPLAFLQFPWRFMGPVAFCLATLAGMNTVWIGRLRPHPPQLRQPSPSMQRGKRSVLGRLTRHNLVVAGLVVVIVGLALPALYVDEWEHLTVEASVAAYHQAEIGGLQRGTTFSNEFLPRAVQVEPDATDHLIADYADGYPVSRVNPETLPEGVLVERLDDGPQHNLWRVNTPSEFTLEVLTYAFAGWTAEIDGQPVPITPSDPHGLITLPVPAGEHTAHVFLGSTPARDLGMAVTTLSVIGVIGVALLLNREQGIILEKADLNPFPARSLLIGGLVTLLLLAVTMRVGGAWVESPPGQAQLAQYQDVYALGQAIRLLGYDLNGQDFGAGDTLELSLYWYADGAIPYGYASFVHVSQGGPPLAQADKQNPAGRPTKTWTTEGFIRDDYSIRLPDEIPPGEYSLLVGLYTCDTRAPGECGNGERLMVTDAQGEVVGDALPLARVTVGN